jgi:hypothetical protein
MRLRLALLCAFLAPATAVAGGRGEMALTAGPGVAIAKLADTQAGAAADARFLYGLSDAWSARLGLAAIWLPGRDGAAASRLVAPSVGLTLAADVLTFVPFVEVALTFTDVRGGGLTSRQYLGGEAGLGVDYLLSRHTTLSLLARADYLAVHLAGAATPTPFAATLALHLGRVF